MSMFLPYTGEPGFRESQKSLLLEFEFRMKLCLPAGLPLALGGRGCQKRQSCYLLDRWKYQSRSPTSRRGGRRRVHLRGKNIHLCARKAVVPIRLPYIILIPCGSRRQEKSGEDGVHKAKTGFRTVLQFGA